ncbi:MAG: methyltransferase domain-containing protein [Nanoarchaeota archaeon]|nr:methyltransferase domain-containing protein [Nanoarchaeota archaeon]
MGQLTEFNEVYERLRASSKDWKRISIVKESLSTIVRDILRYLPSPKAFKYIGSTESGSMTKMGRDIDCLLAFEPYSSDLFRESLMNHGTLENMVFRKSDVVPDIATAFYGGEKIGFIGIEYGKDPLNDLQGDVWLHPSFSRQHLDRTQVRDVVLGKILFHVLGIPKKHFGGGFTIEQLISQYGNFENLLNEFSRSKKIYVDFSTKYRGQSNLLVVTYPFCGLKNLAESFTAEELQVISDYSKRILDSPKLFLEDSVTMFNRNLWSERAKKLGSSEAFSSPDIYLTRKENRIVNKLLRKILPRRILDLGCANGYSTIGMTRGLDSEIIGLDNNSDAIRFAKRFAREKHNTSFVIGNMDSLDFENGYFDVVILKRALENMTSRDSQSRVINEVGRVLKEGGKLYLFDATQDSINKISDLREAYGLPGLTQQNHTYVLSEELLLKIVKDSFYLERIIDKTSTYHFITRILYPLAFRVMGKDMDKLRFDTSLHRISSFLPSLGGLGLYKLYQFRKNE